MADLLSTSMSDLWMPQMVLGIHAWIRAVTRNSTAKQPQLRNEVFGNGRFLIAARCDRNRYRTSPAQPVHAMQAYKKGVRLLAERYGATIDYANDAGLTLIASDGTICFTPTSKNDMNCKITSPKIHVAFSCPKVSVFDIVDRFAKGKHLAGYKPKGNPLALQE